MNLEELPKIFEEIKLQLVDIRKKIQEHQALVQGQNKTINEKFRILSKYLGITFRFNEPKSGAWYIDTNGFTEPIRIPHDRKAW